MACHHVAPTPCWIRAPIFRHHVSWSIRFPPNSAHTFAYRPHLRIEIQNYTSKFRLSIRFGEWNSFELPATNRIGGLSACNSICRATYCPSKWAYQSPRLSESRTTFMVLIVVMCHGNGPKCASTHLIRHLNRFDWVRCRFDLSLLVRMGYGSTDEWRKWFLVLVGRASVIGQPLPLRCAALAHSRPWWFAYGSWPSMHGTPSSGDGTHDDMPENERKRFMEIRIIRMFNVNRGKRHFRTLNIWEDLRVF